MNSDVREEAERRGSGEKQVWLVLLICFICAVTGFATFLVGFSVVSQNTKRISAVSDRLEGTDIRELRATLREVRDEQLRRTKEVSSTELLQERLEALEREMALLREREKARQEGREK